MQKTNEQLAYEWICKPRNRIIFERMCRRAYTVAFKCERDGHKRSFRVRGTIELFRSENLSANRAEGTDYVYPNSITRSLGRYIVELNPSTAGVVKLSTNKRVIERDHELPPLPEAIRQVCSFG